MSAEMAHRSNETYKTLHDTDENTNLLNPQVALTDKYGNDLCFVPRCGRAGLSRAGCAME
jgi:hypothetical protein